MALPDLMLKTGLAMFGKAATQTAQKAVTAAAAGNDPWKTGKDDYGQTDFSVQLKKAMSAGASAGEVQGILDQRTQKVASAPGYSQYAYDDVYKEAQAYINAQQPTTTKSKSTSKNYDLSSYQTQQSAAEIEAALADLKGAYAKGMAAYDAQADKLPERYRAAMNSAAAQSAMAKKAFGEQAAASGLNSGASGQAALDASAVYQGNISSLQQARAQDLAEIDRAKADLTAQYETAVAKAKAEGNAELARALYQEMVRVQGLEREDEQIAYDRERDALADQRYDQQYADMLAAEEYDKKATRAAFLAQIGNFSGYAELWGLSQEETAQLVAEYARQKQLSEQQAAYELEAMGLNNQLLTKQVANYGKSTGGGGGQTNQTNQTKNQFYESIVKNAKNYTDIKEAKAYLERMVDDGYLGKDEAAIIYQVELGGTAELGGYVPASYDELVAFLPAGIVPYSELEFKGRKAANGPAVAQYTDYQDYLKKMYQKYNK